MAINYNIQAEIIDISIDTPKSEDIFFVDTNIWYWTTYSNASSKIPNAVTIYQNYLNSALNQSSKIFYSGLTLSELAHIIEKTERDIFNTQNLQQGNPIFKTKEFRHNSSEYARTVSEIKTAWAQVESLGGALPLHVNSSLCSEALKRLGGDKVDGYDLFILESMKNAGITNIITDDGDFSSVCGLRMFTTNKNVIQAATAQGKLITR